ncbi:MAG: ATP synthase F0 subunit C [Acidobacteriota bacterium]|nr:ATP synthase F0 subunit C [Acidobacteriota bacterium]MDW3228339.1 ATP synthase F0 subunit C [Acidobacteriota bacterium]MDY0231897.1 ATP synthase F0 subunit C [Candidatus Saccharicenans sp.]
MSKKSKILSLAIFLAMLSLTPLSAQTIDPARAGLFRLSLIMGAVIITLSVIVGALAQAKAISSACEGISRNPAAGGHIRGILIFGLVLIETLVIYALLITIIILMVKWGAY